LRCERRVIARNGLNIKYSDLFEKTFLKKQCEHLWAIILAGGDDLRLRENLKTNRNIDCPKQFVGYRLRAVVPTARRQVVAELIRHPLVTT